ncbi:hypothetical protein AB0E62_21960 [Streptomyces sp. NPDC038707]|uniref:hypothetical protein n=1 Tax=Streptomyces sp. NPDC038707 TaxID=3154329 RepID=UPI0033C0CBBE
MVGNSTHAAHVEEARTAGRLNSMARSAGKTRAAHFWANDVDGTHKPPGHLLAITEKIVSTVNGHELKNE